MTKLKLLALGVLIATSAGVAHAEGKFSPGAGVGVVEHPYKDYDTDVYPVPVINYEGDNFWFRGLGGGYYLWNDATDKLSITAYWSPLYFKAKDSGDHQMRHPDDRKSTMMAGLSYAHFTQYGYLRTTTAGDTTDNSNGIVWDMASVVSLHQRWPDRDSGYWCAVEQRKPERILLWRIAQRVRSQRSAWL